MEPSAFAKWLDSAFAFFDYSILNFYHSLAENTGWLLTPIMNTLSFVGELGAVGLIIGIILMLFKRTRKAGFSMLLAVGIGAIFTNLTIKDLVARARPFQSGNTDIIAWWNAVGAPTVSEHSFPSGHVTAASAAMTALCVTQKPRWIIAPAAAYVVAMMAARNYLMVHYPTDVIAGLFVGAVAGTASFFAVMGLTVLLEKHRDNKFCSFLLKSDIRNIFKKRKETK